MIETLAPLLARVSDAADAPSVRALVLLGSMARGEATRWSDTDVERWVGTERDVFETPPQLVDGRLLTISTRAIADVRSDLAAPERAIWAVPAYRAMRVLVDRSDDAPAIASAAASFSWEAVRGDADRFVRLQLAKSTEFLFKIRSASERGDELSALHAAGSLFGGCVRAVAVSRALFLRTENEYFRIVCDAAGPEWTQLFRSSLGIEGTSAPLAQARASCRLYALTLGIVDGSLDTATRELAAPALEVTG